MKFLKIILFVVGFCTLASCKQNEGRTAEQILQNANIAFEQNNYELSKLYIDSLNVEFPRAVKERGEAKDLMYKIEYIEAQRNIQYCDSMLALQYELLKGYEGKFYASPDSVYTGYKFYLHKGQKNNVARTGIFCEVYTDGTLALISKYCGRNLKHNRCKVMIDNLFVETSPVPPSFYYDFLDEGTHWEHIRIMPEYQNGVAAFIASNIDKTFKVNLLSDSGSNVYYLENRDKTAIAEAYSLSLIKQEIFGLENNLKTSINKKQWLENKINQQ